MSKEWSKPLAVVKAGLAAGGGTKATSLYRLFNKSGLSDARLCVITDHQEPTTPWDLTCRKGQRSHLGFARDPGCLGMHVGLLGRRPTQNPEEW